MYGLNIEEREATRSQRGNLQQEITDAQLFGRDATWQFAT